MRVAALSSRVLSVYVNIYGFVGTFASEMQLFIVIIVTYTTHVKKKCVKCIIGVDRTRIRQYNRVYPAGIYTISPITTPVGYVLLT